MKIPIEISGRHLHLSQKDLNKLFGKNYKLKKLRSLSQIGEFAAKEIVMAITSKASLKLRVLGPTRQQTQIEISKTDSLKLGIKASVRLSGDLKKSAGIKLIGSVGEVKLKQGVIIAQRHIHLDDQTAKKLRVKNNQIVSVKTQGTRGIIFNNTIIRINPKFKSAMHIDTDEANAAGIDKKSKGEIMLA
ncbi:MAG: phosphate propanoyltransferase [Candidatus Falkowbacteria bacterium]